MSRLFYFGSSWLKFVRPRCFKTTEQKSTRAFHLLISFAIQILSAICYVYFSGSARTVGISFGTLCKKQARINMEMNISVFNSSTTTRLLYFHNIIIFDIKSLVDKMHLFVCALLFFFFDFGLHTNLSIIWNILYNFFFVRATLAMLIKDTIQFLLFVKNSWNINTVTNVTMNPFHNIWSDIKYTAARLGVGASSLFYASSMWKENVFILIFALYHEL